jgi:hypothetical protein
MRLVWRFNRFFSIAVLRRSDEDSRDIFGRPELRKTARSADEIVNRGKEMACLTASV